MTGDGDKIAGRIPLLKGEGAAKRRVRGAEIFFTPHPVLRTTLSR
jgi:hypothetical protein